MILRKPFRILIKHFKLIHFILMLFMVYVIYSTNGILSFLNEYMNTTTYLITHDAFLTIFKPSINICIFIILLCTIVILGLMAFKKKPIRFYFVNIVVYIYTFIILLIVRNTISTLEVNLVDVRTLKLSQDLLVSSVIFQGLALLFVAIRATGFDIKKFNFVKDLEELDIDSKDNEEFEINFDVDTNQYVRKIRKLLRHIKYLYVENKYIFSVGISLVVALVCFLIYLNITVYNKTFNENTAFQTSEFTINIKKTYLTNTDIYGNSLDKNYHYVIVPISIKQPTNHEKYMKSVSLVLEINEHRFYHTIDYKTEFRDFGNIYKEENIGNSFQNYILVYKIPNSYINDKMTLKFYDVNRKVITVKIKPENLTKEKDLGTIALTEKVDLSKTILKKSEFQIDSFDISQVFEEKYQYCNKLGDCYESIEYIKPGFNSNEEKTILKLKGNISLDSELSIKIETMTTFIKNFGSLVYKIDDKEKTISLNLPSIKATKTYDAMVSYIEVPKEVEEATNIILKIKIRNKVYNCVLK